jgi:N-acetylmuramoyl-L-alanine amidase
MAADPRPQPILRRGANGPAVFALREHLRQLGFKFGSERDFGPRTEAAVTEFQAGRGLRADGICGPQTWAALGEAGFALGDRILSHRRPNLRGDDVVALQVRLSALGFDPGRPDGIFGPDTEVALREFQRSAGIASDGVCGPATIVALDRLDALAGGSVAELREREALHLEPRTVHGRRIAVHGAGDLATVADALAEQLRGLGAEVLMLLEVDDRAAARAANDSSVDLIVSLRDPDPLGPTVCFFGQSRSVAGHSHALRIAAHLCRTEHRSPVAARTYDILRETRMAAVAVHLPARDRTPAELAECLAAGIRDGFVLDVADLPELPDVSDAERR